MPIVKCPNPLCGAPVAIQAHINQVTFSNNGGMNMPVSCRGCGRWFDAAPVDGTYSDVGGRLVRVARFLVDQSPSELEELRRRLEDLERRQEAAEVGQALESMGVAPPKGGWARTKSAAETTLGMGVKVLDAIGRLLLIYEGGQLVSRADLVGQLEKLLR